MTWSERRGRAQLEMGRCPCPDGAPLAPADGLGWRRCPSCRCLWKLDGRGRCAVARAKACVVS